MMNKDKTALDQVLRQNLQWACQYLSLLHRHGFPTIVEAENALRSQADVLPVAEKLLSGTTHIGHPSLTELRHSAQEYRNALG